MSILHGKGFVCPYAHVEQLRNFQPLQFGDSLMTKRRSFMYLGVLLAAALFAFGCGGNDGGLSSEDMARIDAAEMTAEEAKAALAVLQADMDEADTDPAPEADTSDLADQIAVLEDLVADLTAEPQTIPEILGGKKSTLSAADLAVASKKLAGELKGLYDHDGDKSLVNLPVELTEPAPPVVDGVIKDTRTRDVSHASQLKEGTKYFLRHTFAGTGTKVDLSSQGDLDSLKLGKLLTVDGVDLMSVSIKENRQGDGGRRVSSPSQQCLHGWGHCR